MSEKGKLCPSAPAKEGALLLGIVDGEGCVDILADPLEVDADFMAAAAEGREPERRFRFSSPCMPGRCSQWDGEQCGVARRAQQHFGANPEILSGTPPECALTANCRWVEQLGEQACLYCRHVVTQKEPVSV